MFNRSWILCAVFGCCLQVGCTPSGPPTFTLAVSEYPSWAVFPVASMEGIIDGAAGKQGTVEKKWNVDIVIKEADYDTCMTMYKAPTIADAACLTSLDTLPLAQVRDSVAILPTSTSVGGDACVVVGIDDLEKLKSVTTRGLDQSVSRYVFDRNLEIKGLNPDEFPFKSMDPAAAAKGMQTNQADFTSIMVWNPFVMQTLRTRDDSKRLFDSSTIPNEVIDCVIVGADVLKKPGGEDFACAIVDAYYEVNKRIADPKTHADTLVKLGAKFTNLGLEDMEAVCQQTHFFATPEEALNLLNSDKFQNETNPLVVNFCIKRGMVTPKEGEKQIGFNDGKALLNFTDKYIKAVQK